MKKSKVGRPPKPSGTAQTGTITVKLSLQDKQIIDVAVASAKVGRSTWARKALLYVATNDIGVT
jgi:hypothetical protein